MTAARFASLLAISAAWWALSIVGALYLLGVLS